MIDLPMKYTGFGINVHKLFLWSHIPLNTMSISRLQNTIQLPTLSLYTYMMHEKWKCYSFSGAWGLGRGAWSMELGAWSKALRPDMVCFFHFIITEQSALMDRAKARCLAWINILCLLRLMAATIHGMFYSFKSIVTDRIHWIGHRSDQLHGQTYHVSYDLRPHPDTACLCNFITTI